MGKGYVVFMGAREERIKDFGRKTSKDEALGKKDNVETGLK
jgi:hypothetical protein